MVHAGLFVDRSSRPAKGCGRRAPRRGVTLVELLITMAILTILASVIYGATFSAMESARAARTRTTITKIHTLLMERWESYETRRVALNQNMVSAITANAPSRRVRNEMMTDLRLLALRELMRLEMPDRWCDLLATSVPTSNPASASLATPIFLSPQQLPSLTLNYYQTYLSAANNVTSGEVLYENESAECLYLVITLATGDGEARELFNERDIGDTDGDGALEFLDGWGRPIRFIRWPAGYVRRSTLMSGDGQADHDPFDRFRRDATIVPRQNASNYPYPATMATSIGYIEQRNSANTPPLNLTGFRLVPLVASTGPDGQLGLYIAANWHPLNTEPPVDPYLPSSAGLGSGVSSLQLGYPYDLNAEPTNVTGNVETQKDNITNHDAAR